MPRGPGTYGSKVGRPPKKFKNGNDERNLVMAKKKKVKKFIAGGDVRQSSGPAQEHPSRPIRFPPGGGFGGRGRDSATGQVRQISESADRATDFLSRAGEALGDNDRERGIFGPLGPPPTAVNPFMKKGGKVKKKKKAKKSYNTGGKVRGVGKAVQKKMRPCKMVKM